MSFTKLGKDLTEQEVNQLPIIHIQGDIDRTDLYKKGYAPTGVGMLFDETTVCTKHDTTPLVAIGKRHVEWEDGMGFDQEGYLEVRGCPICLIPAISVLWGCGKNE